MKRFNNPNLLGIFSNLREMVDLLRSEKFEEYLEDPVRRKKYPGLRGGTVTLLFEK